MKKSQIVFLGVIAFMFVILVYRAFATNVLLNWHCTTNSCNETIPIVYTGSTEAGAAGTCDEGSAHLGPEVYINGGLEGCQNPVTLTSQAHGQSNSPYGG